MFVAILRGSSFFPLGFRLDFLFLFLLALNLLVLIMHVIAKIAYIGIFFLCFMAGKGLLGIF